MHAFYAIRMLHIAVISAKSATHTNTQSIWLWVCVCVCSEKLEISMHKEIIFRMQHIVGNLAQNIFFHWFRNKTTYHFKVDICFLFFSPVSWFSILFLCVCARARMFFGALLFMSHFSSLQFHSLSLRSHGFSSYRKHFVVFDMALC